jgi:hypothetical protein
MSTTEISLLTLLQLILEETMVLVAMEVIMKQYKVQLRILKLKTH